MRYLIGLGNYTAYDDSVGVRVVEYVVERSLDRGFRAVDLGADSLDLIAYLVPGTKAILLVDAADMGLAPGDWRFFTPDEVATRKEVPSGSTHAGDVLHVLDLARRTGSPIPPLLFLGIQPAEMRPEIGISPALASRLPEYAAMAVARLLQF